MVFPSTRPFIGPARILAAGFLLSGSAAPGQTPPLEVVHLDAYTVQASPFARSPDELAQPVSILTAQALQLRRSATLGETLSGLPGVSSTWFGPGASRPIIRGLGGDRIRTLVNGLGSADASSLSPDHAVAFEPALARHVEILRGPATLLYGNAAIGGVVNAIDHRVPNEIPESALTGTLDAGLGSAADERALALGLRGASGRIGWQVSAAHRRTHDLEIPGFAAVASVEHEEEEHEGEEHEAEADVFGVLGNSATRTTSASAGLSWFGDGFRLGLAASAMDTRYGVPGHAHAPEDEHEDEEHEHDHEHADVVIELEQRRLDLEVAITRPFAGFRSGTLRLAATDYEHRELEGDEVGTRFTSRGLETRVDLLHEPIGPFEGAIGMQVHRTSLEADGAEAFIPPSRTLNAAIFAVEEIGRGPVRWQLGARLEHQDIALRIPGGGGRDDHAVSLSAGAVWTPDETWSLAASAARTGRMPLVQELFADGPHAATRAYEVGDPSLGRETSTGLDLTLRRRTGPVTGALSLFANSYEDYIFEQPTGETEDGFEVFRFVARDARFVGAEFEATWHVVESEARALHLTGQADFVHGRNRTDDTPLPRMPGRRTALRLDGRTGMWMAGCEAARTGRQERVAPLEQPSPGYTLLSVWLGYRLALRSASIDLILRGSNLTNREARPHTSFLKEVAPLGGRNVSLSARLQF